MNNSKQFDNVLPAFIVGAIEGLIVILALSCFLLSKGVQENLTMFYTGAAILFVALLLGSGAYFTRREEMENLIGESRIIKIYKALDIDGELKNAMIEDSKQENMSWEKEWQESDNATSSITPRAYASSFSLGFLSGGVIILINNFIFQLPNYTALFLPFTLLALLGFYKYKLSGQNPYTGLLFISLSGIAAAAAAHYAGSFF